MYLLNTESTVDYNPLFVIFFFFFCCRFMYDEHGLVSFEITADAFVWVSFQVMNCITTSVTLNGRAFM